jgi:hypothetical protein
MIFFFSKRRLSPLKPEDAAKAWPCPAWDEGPSACEAQLWRDSDKRLANGPTERRYDQGDETMGCKWYDAMARLSPCEGRVGPTLIVYLYDHYGKLSRNAPYRIEANRQIREGYTDGDGRLCEPNLGRGDYATIEWSNPDPADPSARPKYYSEYARIHLDTQEADADDGRVDRQLWNLGYWHEERAHNLDAFRREYGSGQDSSDQGIDTTHRTAQEKQRRSIS